MVPLKLALQLANQLSADMKKGQKLSKESKQVGFSAMELMTPYWFTSQGGNFHGDSLMSFKDSSLPFSEVPKRDSFLYKDFYISQKV